MGLQWVPWLALTLAFVTLEWCGYRDGTGQTWTLSRVMWWLSDRIVILKWCGAAFFVWLWRHWFWR